MWSTRALCEISIHAPARGATLTFTVHNTRIKDFNPRSREGSDSIQRHTDIHPVYFNPRSREGSDYSRLRLAAWCQSFQSTLPRGERRKNFDMSKRVDKISIHAPARGATLISAPGWSHKAISIHAPARGATCVGRVSYRRNNISIHAPARGATHNAVSY